MVCLSSVEDRIIQLLPKLSPAGDKIAWTEWSVRPLAKLENAADDTYVNATQMCKATGKKWNDYRRLGTTVLTTVIRDLGFRGLANGPLG